MVKRIANLYPLSSASQIRSTYYEPAWYRYVSIQYRYFACNLLDSCPTGRNLLLFYSLAILLSIPDGDAPDPSTGLLMSRSPRNDHSTSICFLNQMISFSWWNLMLWADCPRSFEFNRPRLTLPTIRTGVGAEMHTGLDCHFGKRHTFIAGMCCLLYIICYADYSFSAGNYMLKSPSFRKP
jgi:hypothetical protein